MNTFNPHKTVSNNLFPPTEPGTIDNYLHIMALYDTMTPESLEFLVERTRMEIKRKELLSFHKTPIKQLPNGRWYTRIEGRKVERKTKEEIENLIIEKYRDNNVTLTSIFYNYLLRRKKTVAATTWAKDNCYFDYFVKSSSIADIPLNKLTLDDGYSFLDHCLLIKPNLKRKYWNNLIGFLNNMFQYAIDRNIISDNPFRHLKPKKDLFAADTTTRDGDTVFTKAEQTKVCTLAEADAEKTGKSEPLGIVVLFNLGIRDGDMDMMQYLDSLSETVDDNIVPFAKRA